MTESFSLLVDRLLTTREIARQHRISICVCSQSVFLLKDYSRRRIDPVSDYVTDILSTEHANVMKRSELVELE